MGAAGVNFTVGSFFRGTSVGAIVPIGFFRLDCIVLIAVTPVNSWVACCNTRLFGSDPVLSRSYY